MHLAFVESDLFCCDFERNQFQDSPNIDLLKYLLKIGS